MENNRRVIEIFKNITIVVLLVLTILLLYFFWNDIKLEDISLRSLLDQSRSEGYELIEVDSVLIPENMEICLDETTYSRADELTEELWQGSDRVQSLKDAVITVLSTSDTILEEITEEEYYEAMEFLSVRAVFDINLPFGGYCDYMGLRRPINSDNLLEINEIGFSMGAVDSLFIYDGSQGRYFRIASEYDASELLTSQQSLIAESSNLTYYPLDQFIGAETAAWTMVPTYLETGLTEQTAGKEFTNGDTAYISEMARNIFSGSFDFVRKIEEESGRTIYMYGYSEELLTFDDGLVTYRAEAGGNTSAGTSGSTMGYFEALETALADVSVQGGFRDRNGNSYDVRLSGSYEVENGYGFRFQMMLDGAAVFYSDGYMLDCQVADGMLTYMDREFLDVQGGKTPDASGSESDASGQLREAYSPANVLAQNYGYIYGQLTESGVEDGSAPTSLQFDIAAGHITDMDYGYCYLRGNSQGSAGSLIPCYRVELDSGDICYINLYTAEIIQGEESYGLE